MGNYDVFTQYVRNFGHNHSRTTAHARQGDRVVQPAPYLCPQCGEKFTLPGACDRCEVATYDSSCTVAVRRDASHATLPPSGLSTPVTVLLSAGGIVTSFFADPLVSLWNPALVLAALGVGASVGPLISLAVRSARRWRHRRVVRKNKKERANHGRDLLKQSIAELPRDAEVRFAGEVQIGANAPGEVRVVDDTGEILVRIADNVVAYDGDEESVEFLTAGDQVEVVGYRGDGPSYRTVENFGAGQPVTIFVRRKKS